MLSVVVDALGADRVERRFDCCDTTFQVVAAGVRAEWAAKAAEQRARTLEAQLDAFADDSAVTRLNATGSVENPHVAAVAERGLEYRERTQGAFDVGRGDLEHAIKAYLRGDADTVGPPASLARVSVGGDRVTASSPVDLNGLAKGYIVDRAAEILASVGRTGFVDGGGDIAGPTGPVGVESPFGDDAPLAVLETDWNVATSAGHRRRRGAVDHVYDPRSGRIGAAHDQVTVVARRDCMEADALATTLCALPLAASLALAEAWPGLEALLVHGGVYHRTEGFHAHEQAR